MYEINYTQILLASIPEIILVVAALATLAIDLGLLRQAPIPRRFLAGAATSSLGCIAAISWIALHPLETNLLNGMVVINPLIQLVQIVLLALAIFTIGLSVESTFTKHVGEYLLFLVLATAAMLFMVGTQDVLLIFVSLELLSLSLYTLTAFNKHNIKSAEAAMKYYLYGGMSAAFLLFGLSFLYGASGSTNLVEIAKAIQSAPQDPLTIVAIVTTIIGFGFKVAAVPFHLWAPDAYQGAPTPSAAFIASCSKVASFFVFAQVLMIGFSGAEGSASFRDHATGWVLIVGVAAAASMVLGNLAALMQQSVRRLLAYSAIAHGGYMLLGIMSHSRQGTVGLLYYVITYALTTIGAFGVVAVVEKDTGSDTLSSFIGLSRRAPFLAFCALIFFLSLAGIPPLAGFFGKFYLFSAALSSTFGGLGLLWFVLLAIAVSAVSLYYYLQVLKKIYVEETSQTGSLQVSTVTQLVLLFLAVSVVVLGCFPTLLTGPLEHALPVIR